MTTGPGWNVSGPAPSRNGRQTVAAMAVAACLGRAGRSTVWWGPMALKRVLRALGLQSIEFIPVLAAPLLGGAGRNRALGHAI